MFARSITNLLGAAAVLGALIAAAMPLALDAVDRTGRPIPCGTGFGPAYTAAAKLDLFNLDQYTLAGPGMAVSDYSDQCAGLVGVRRAAAVSVGAGGAALMLAAFATPHLMRVRASRRRGQAEHPGPAEAVGDQPLDTRMVAQWFADDVGTGVTQPILEKSVGQQVGSHSYAAVAAAALRGDGSGHAGSTGGGVGQLYAVSGNG